MTTTNNQQSTTNNQEINNICELLTQEQKEAAEHIGIEGLLNHINNLLKMKNCEIIQKEDGTLEKIE